MSSGGAASGQKGKRYEQELVNRFKANGWGALRLGASGSGGDADLPDVLAANPNFGKLGSALKHTPTFTYCLAVELKSGKATTLYVEAEEVEALEAFARIWGARPFLGARFTTQGSSTATYLVAPERARGPTDAGRYGLPVADIDERAAVVVTEAGVERRE